MTLPVDLTTLPTGLNPLELLMENFEYLLGLIVAGQTLPPRVVTGNGPFVVTATDTALVLNRTIPGASAVSLPPVATRHGLGLVISDFAGNAGDITITPAPGETIMGLGSAVLASTAQGLGTAGSITLYPLSSINGWYVG